MQDINNGLALNDGLGDRGRVGFIKVDDNFRGVYSVDSLGVAIPSVTNRVLATGSGSDTLASFRATTDSDIPATLSGKTLNSSILNTPAINTPAITTPSCTTLSVTSPSLVNLTSTGGTFTDVDISGSVQYEQRVTLASGTMDGLTTSTIAWPINTGDYDKYVLYFKPRFSTNSIMYCALDLSGSTVTFPHVRSIRSDYSTTYTSTGLRADVAVINLAGTGGNTVYRSTVEYAITKRPGGGWLATMIFVQHGRDGFGYTTINTPVAFTTDTTANGLKVWLSSGTFLTDTPYTLYGIIDA